jgi:hydrogenase-4 component F
MAWLTPISTRILIVGLFAVTACPPFGPFFSELRILQASFGGGHYWGGAMFLGCLLLAFFGMTRLVFGITDGRPTLAARKSASRFTETAGVILPPMLLLAVSLWLGIATPESLRAVWQAAVDSLSTTP